VFFIAFHVINVIFSITFLNYKSKEQSIKNQPAEEKKQNEKPNQKETNYDITRHTASLTLIGTRPLPVLPSSFRPFGAE